MIEMKVLEYKSNDEDYSDEPNKKRAKLRTTSNKQTKH
jgi:hypothetical protein